MEFDVIFPTQGRMQFDGGLSNKYERALIPDNESPDCFNVVFSAGAVETRGGSTKLTSFAIGGASFVGDGLYTRRDNTGAETMVAFAGGTAWQWTGTTFTTIASAQSVFTAGVRVGTTQYENHMFVGNGYVTPYKYNGAHWTRHGVPRASISGCTGAVSGGGSLTTATYYYKIAFVNSAAAIGDVSTASTGFAITTTTGAVNLTGIPVAPTSHGVSSRRIYRASAAAGTYGLIATINDNSTTTYSDTNGTESTAAPTDNGEPPVYSIAVQHQNRLFMNDTANPNYVWWTELFEPYTVKATNFQPIGDASQDLVKGMDVYTNGILVRCERQSYLWYMPTTDPDDWGVIAINSPYGSRSPFGAFLYNNRLMFPAMQSGKFVGFAALSGTSIDPTATNLETSKAGSDLQSDRIEPSIFTVQESYVSNISAMVFKNRAYIAVTYGDNQTQNNRVFVFDFSISNLSKSQDAAWSIMGGINAAQFTVYNGKLYFIDSTATGFVRELDTTSNNDDGSAIVSYFWTKEFAGKKGHENLQKDFRKAYVLVERSGAYYMNFTYRVDSDSGEGITKQIDLDPGGSTWNGFNWGAAEWGGGRDQDEIEVPLGTASGKRIQFKFSNQSAANQKFKVIGMKLKYNVKGKR